MRSESDSMRTAMLIVMWRVSPCLHESSTHTGFKTSRNVLFLLLNFILIVLSFMATIVASLLSRIAGKWTGII